MFYYKIYTFSEISLNFGTHSNIFMAIQSLAC